MPKGVFPNRATNVDVSLWRSGLDGQCQNPRNFFCVIGFLHIGKYLFSVISSGGKFGRSVALAIAIRWRMDLLTSVGSRRFWNSGGGLDDTPSHLSVLTIIYASSRPVVELRGRFGPVAWMLEANRKHIV
jgi:hypothetical protein